MTNTQQRPVIARTPTTRGASRLHGILAAALALAGLGVLAASCGGASFIGDCTIGGKACTFGCVSNVGCAECGVDGDCAATEPYCILGKCVVCSSTSDCATGEACFPRDHRCKTKCSTNANCEKDEPICDEDGACVGCRDDDDCPATEPICDSTRSQCAQCGSNGDCSAAKPICDLGHGTCRQCVIDDDCESGFLCGGNHECHPGCQSNGDCNDNDRPICDTGTGVCVGCNNNSDCGVAAPICRNDGRCGQCGKDSDCGVAAPYCDNDARCAQCLQDAQCPAGDKCKDGVCEPK